MSDKKKGETPLETIVEDLAELAIAYSREEEDAVVHTEQMDQGGEPSIPQPQPAEMALDTGNVQTEARSGETSGQADNDNRGHSIYYPPFPLPFAPTSFSFTL